MKKFWSDNEALIELLIEHEINLICNKNMENEVSDEDAERIPELIERLAPAAAYDYGFVEDEMMDELIDSIDFTEDEYNERVEGIDDVATFSDFLADIISSVRDNNGSLEDAVFIANNAFAKL